MDTAAITPILMWTAIIAIIVYSVISTILFVKDGKSAKQNNTKRHTKYTVMFIIGIALFAVLMLFVILGIMLIALSGLVMLGM